MKLVFSEQAWEDYLYWQQADRKILTRIHKLVREVSREPFIGTGKPEALRHALAGYWSRRITDEHRFVYKVSEGTVGDGSVSERTLLVAQLRYHY